MNDRDDVKAKGDRAEELFLSGYNCSQAVCGAFADEIGLPFEKAITLCSGFGGGFSRTREVCGTVSGGVIVLSSIYGYSDIKDPALKKNTYTMIQSYMMAFEEKCGSYICKDILKLKKGEDTSLEHISERNHSFYSNRPCPGLCRISAELVQEIINSNR